MTWLNHDILTTVSLVRTIPAVDYPIATKAIIEALIGTADELQLFVVTAYYTYNFILKNNCVKASQ